MGIGHVVEHSRLTAKSNVEGMRLIMNQCGGGGEENTSPVLSGPVLQDYLTDSHKSYDMGFWGCLNVKKSGAIGLRIVCSLPGARRPVSATSSRPTHSGKKKNMGTSATTPIHGL